MSFDRLITLSKIEGQGAKKVLSEVSKHSRLVRRSPELVEWAKADDILMVGRKAFRLTIL
jgi:hypothetical protein